MLPLWLISGSFHESYQDTNVGLTDDGSCGLSAKVCVQGYAAVVKHDTASTLAVEQINVHFGGEIGGIKAFNHLHRGASVLG